MGCMPYDTVDDANRRLRSSIILYDGKPVYVSEVMGPGHNRTMPLHNMEAVVIPLPYKASSSFHIRLDDPLISVAGFNCGFANGKLNTAFWRRLPLRGNSQGLTSDNFNCAILDMELQYELAGMSNAIVHQSFADMFLGKYPTLEELEPQLEKSPFCAAFSRNFALQRDSFRDDYLLYYRITPVGYGNPFKEGVTLTKDYKHLAEQLKERKVNVT